MGPLNYFEKTDLSCSLPEIFSENLLGTPATSTGIEFLRFTFRSSSVLISALVRNGSLTM